MVAALASRRHLRVKATFRATTKYEKGTDVTWCPLWFRSSSFALGRDCIEYLCRRVDLNHRPEAYEASALTD